MKKLLSIIGLFILFCSTSCNKDLTIAPLSIGTTETFYLTHEDFIQGMNAVYNSLRTYPDRLINLSETRSDNLYAASVLGVQPYDAIRSFRRNATSNVYIEAAWNDNFNAIFRANNFLEQVDLKGGVINSDAIRERLKAEARFLRAFFYFDMVRYYGKVPLVTKPVTANEAVTIPRSPVDDVYKQIIADLEFAALTLPPSYTGNDVGRATRYAAQGLLAMVYMARSGPTYSIEGPGLNTNEWTQALGLLNQVISSNAFTFNPNYTNVFSYANQNPSVNKEAVFSVMHVSGLNPILGASFVSLTVPDAYFTSVLLKPAQLGGAGRPCPRDLESSYEATDIRPKFNFIPYYTQLGIPGVRPYLRKYMDSTKVPVNIRDWGINFMAIRYTDLLLLKAECILKGATGGTQAEVNAIVNQVRVRAGVPALTTDVTIEQLYAERRRELVGEGSRWFDLQRSGTLITTMNSWIAANDDLKQIEPVVADLILYPVPQSQLDAQPGLYSQNPGY
jgi:hypothetical protein